jgi:hypothetical protein
MSENTKKLLLVLGVGAIILYLYRRNKQLDQTLNELKSLPAEQDNSGSETAKKNEEFANKDEYCDLISYFKGGLNLFKGYDYYNSDSLIDAEFYTELQKILEGTTHFFNENGAIRKSFLYDFDKTVANAIGIDIPPREFNYQYTSGILTLGDKGNDVKMLQELINSLYANVEFTERLDVNSTYDKATLAAVQKVFAGTTALIDDTKGSLSKEFVNNFTTIINNLKIN